MRVRRENENTVLFELYENDLTALHKDINHMKNPYDLMDVATFLVSVLMPHVDYDEKPGVETIVSREEDAIVMEFVIHGGILNEDDMPYDFDMICDTYDILETARGGDWQNALPCEEYNNTGVVNNQSLYDASKIVDIYQPNDDTDEEYESLQRFEIMFAFKNLSDVIRYAKSIKKTKRDPRSYLISHKSKYYLLLQFRNESDDLVNAYAYASDELSETICVEKIEQVAYIREHGTTIFTFNALKKLRAM